VHPSAILHSRIQLDNSVLFNLQIPGVDRPCQPGQFFMLRAGSQWSPYLRQPLFPAAIEPHRILLWGAPAWDPGLEWLANQPDGTPVDLLGPLGKGFSIHAHQKHLLLVAQANRLAALLSLVSPQLNRQGSVGLLLEATPGTDLLPPGLLPPAVEYYTVTPDGSSGQLEELLDRGLPWADSVCAAGSTSFLRRLKERLGHVRFGVRSGFAQALAPVPLPCGNGACLACLVDSGRGWHRACVRGPVFDIVELSL
jgi:dihydroorotate dehydrogenase electron transfer subunit